MNARGISLVVISLLLLSVLLIKEPAAVAADADAKEYAALVARVEALESALRDQQGMQDLVKLKLRVADLERIANENRRGSSNATSRSPAGDISQLKRENATLRRDITALETVIHRVEMAAVPLQREIDRLRLSVSNLQNEVERLKSKR